MNYSKTSYKIVIALFLTLLVILLLLFLLKSDISMSDFSNIQPGIQVYSDKIDVYGAVPVNSVYITNIKSTLSDRVLYITFTGYKIPFSTVEGEYYFVLNNKSATFDKIVYLNADKSTKTLYVNHQ